MTHSISSAAFVSATLLAMSGIGLSGHLRQSESVAFAGFLDGSAQTVYEAGFDRANAVSSAAVDAMGALNFAVFGQASKGAIVGNDGWMFTAEELEVSESFDANIAVAAEQIAGAVTSLQTRGITVLPVIIPDKTDIYAVNLGVERPDAIKNRLARFQTELSEKGVAFLDGRSAMIGAAQSGEVFVKDDTHWSPLGSRKIAKAVANELINVDLTQAAVHTTQGPTVPYDGDLLSFVPTGSWRPVVGPDQYSIETFKTEVDAQGGLFGAPDVEVALVGTSFSARSAFHFEGFLKQALQADVLNFAQEGQGPFAPMEAFLASEFLKTTPPKVVIWEIPVRYVSKDL